MPACISSHFPCLFLFLIFHPEISLLKSSSASYSSSSSSSSSPSTTIVFVTIVITIHRKDVRTNSHKQSGVASRKVGKEINELPNIVFLDNLDHFDLWCSPHSYYFVVYICATSVCTYVCLWAAWGYVILALMYLLVIMPTLYDTFSNNHVQIAPWQCLTIIVFSK